MIKISFDISSIKDGSTSVKSSNVKRIKGSLTAHQQLINFKSNNGNVQITKKLFDLEINNNK